MTIDINELRRLAKAATPPRTWYVQVGDYIYGCKDVTDGDGDGDGDGEEGWRPVIANTEDGEPVNFEGSVAAFIAVASPTSILELLDRLEAAEKAACQGAKCGCIDGYSHSPECVVEAAACQGWLNTPEAVDALLKVMVDRFLGWKLPKDFAPDCHVHFDREAADAFVESWPSGTNLLHAGQAMEMFKHCLPAELIIPERVAERQSDCRTGEIEMINTEELRKLAHRHAQVALSIPIKPAMLSALLDRLEAAEAEALEQARVNGMGSEREAALMAKLEAAEKERDQLRSDLATAEQDSRQKQARIERLEEALSEIAWSAWSNDSGWQSDRAIAALEESK